LHGLSGVDQVKCLLDELSESSSERLRSLDVLSAAFDVVAPLHEVVEGCWTAGRLISRVVGIGFY